MRRFNDFAARLCLPSFDGPSFWSASKNCFAWTKKDPRGAGTDAYGRSSSARRRLGLTQCSEAMILVLMSPVGPYFKSGFVPIKLAVDAKYIRAWPGGTGDVKYEGNYGSTSYFAADAAGGARASPCVRRR